jgi:6-phosphogluconate dehydrogenase
MMSAISEAWTIMTKNMGMSYDEVGEIFEKWSSEGELVLPLFSPLNSCL